MFRKTKRSAKKDALRNKRKRFEDDDDDEKERTSELIAEARLANNPKAKTIKKEESVVVMHQYEASSNGIVSEKDLATRTAEYHPESKNEQEETGKGQDGIFRDKKRNRFLAGPSKVSTFVRTTCRFDYQPDICKDYKETGFCGFGDSCIYLHDRGDTLTGWQLEQQWEEQRKKDQAKKELEAFADGKETREKEQVLGDDGLPFACHICREAFREPVVTSCGHYFCEKCIMDWVRRGDEKAACPICGKDTHGVFNRPTKLISKKRRLVGSSATWQDYLDACKKLSQEKQG